jgi:hypothetical protein
LLLSAGLIEVEMRRRSGVDYVVNEHGCWIWQLARNSGGYGVKWDRQERRLVLAHRWHFERLNGPISDGLQVDHLCKVRLCVNPAHLEAVTPRVNNERKLHPDGRRPPPVVERPAGRQVDSADCMIWQGGLDRDGYGARWVDGRRVFVHRWAYEQVHGPIPSGLELDHLCRNRACYNAAHLEAVTHKENVRRARWRDVCRHGHPMIPENVLLQKDGRHKCRACNVERAARYRQRRRLQREREKQERRGQGA